MIDSLNLSFAEVRRGIDTPSTHLTTTEVNISHYSDHAFRYLKTFHVMM